VTVEVPAVSKNTRAHTAAGKRGRGESSESEESEDSERDSVIVVEDDEPPKKKAKVVGGKGKGKEKEKEKGKSGKEEDSLVRVTRALAYGLIAFGSSVISTLDSSR